MNIQGRASQPLLSLRSHYTSTATLLLQRQVRSVVADITAHLPESASLSRTDLGAVPGILDCEMPLFEPAFESLAGGVPDLGIGLPSNTDFIVAQVADASVVVHYASSPKSFDPFP